MKLFFKGRSITEDFSSSVIQELTTMGYAVEDKEENKMSCDYIFYLLDSSMDQIYDIIDSVNDGNHFPSKTIFCYSTDSVGDKTFNDHQIKSLKATGKIIERNGAHWFNHLDEAFSYLEKQL